MATPIKGHQCWGHGHVQGARPRGGAGRIAWAVYGPGAPEAASGLASSLGISGTLRNPLGPWVGKRGPLVIRGRTEVAATWAGLGLPSGVTGHCSGDTELGPIKTPQLSQVLRSQRGLPLWTGHCLLLQEPLAHTHDKMWTPGALQPSMKKWRPLGGRRPPVWHTGALWAGLCV
uniref:Uncharacterized protein n=1 Tax=Molossus molossus TaxID=27622 RepID=A0A7J8ERE5_MOLMO|nr:hypothetical protein HJG59_008757 [Molossus molossus]